MNLPTVFLSGSPSEQSIEEPISNELAVAKVEMNKVEIVGRASSKSFHRRVPRGTRALSSRWTPTTLTGTSPTSGGRSIPTTAGESEVLSELIHMCKNN